MKILSGFLLLCCPTLACACGLVQTSCNSLGDKSSVVFLGTVLSPDDPETESMLHGSPIIFKVTERLRGSFSWKDERGDQDGPAIDLGKGQHLKNMMFVLH